MRTVFPERLTAETFAPYGDVIEPQSAAQTLSINYGNTTRFDDLFSLDVLDNGGEPCVSIFRSNPIELPFTIEGMEYHPLGSQAFIPLGREPYLVVVAPAGPFDPAAIKVFLASPEQGVNYHKGTWHHYSLALHTQSDFLVIDRKGSAMNEDCNCIEVALDAAAQIKILL